VTLSITCTIGTLNAIMQGQMRRFWISGLELFKGRFVKKIGKSLSQGMTPRAASAFFQHRSLSLIWVHPHSVSFH
jgi:hypothetical protein